MSGAEVFHFQFYQPALFQRKPAAGFASRQQGDQITQIRLVTNQQNSLGRRSKPAQFGDQLLRIATGLEAVRKPELLS